MTAKFLTLGALTLAVTAAACTADISGPGGSNPGDPNQPGNGLGGGANNNSGGSANQSGSSGGGGEAGVGLPGTLKYDDPPNYYRVVRLTNDQWTKSVQSVLALSAPPTNAENFQNAVSGTTNFTNNEKLLEVDSRAWTDFQSAAEALAKQVSSDSSALSKLYSGMDAAGFIKTVGRRIYRRPLTDAEVTTYQTLFTSAANYTGTQSAFAKGAGLVIEAMFQSPHFLYRTELGAVNSPLSSYEMAAKLSLFLQDRGPDDATLDAAGGSGKFDTAEGAATLAQKLMEDPAAKAVMRKFHGQFLRFDRFSQLNKVGVANYDPAINADLAESAYLFFDRVFSSQGVKDIFTSTKGFVSAKMAPLYGGSAPASGFEERELGANRVGYFTQVPFLMLYGHNASPDSIHRGVNIAIDVLCAPLGPPAMVIPSLPDPQPGQTNRMRVDKFTSGCGKACHNDMINPLGFAFENFDGMGQYRTIENGSGGMLPIDASGAFQFTDGMKSYKDATEFMNVLASNEQTHLCYSKRMASYALQRNIIKGDEAMLEALATKSQTGSVKQLITDIVKQDAFRIRPAGAQ